MLSEIGKIVSSFPRNLKFIRDIEQFEGPILSEYRAEEGGVSYLEKWCTQSEEGHTHRFLLVRSDQRSIAQYLAKRITMRQVLVHTSDGVGFLIDREKVAEKIHVVRAALILLDELPLDYLPEEGTYHDESLRPRTARTLQSFLLGEDWTGELISAIERAYLDAAAFNHFTAFDHDRQPIPDRILQFNYRRGFPVGTAFRVLRAQVPQKNRGRAAGIAAGSPGVLSIEIDTKTAENLLESMRLLERAKPLYDLVQSWSKQDVSNAPAIPHDAIDHLAWFAESLKLDLSRFGDVQAHVHTIGKLLTAYFRKLMKLARLPGNAEFIGLDRSIVPADIFVDEDEDD